MIYETGMIFRQRYIRSIAVIKETFAARKAPQKMSNNWVDLGVLVYCQRQ